MNIKTTTREILFSIFPNKASSSDKDKPINTVKSPLPTLEQESVSRAKIALMPTFHKAPHVQAMDNLEHVCEAIRAMAERVHQKMLASPRGKKILAKVGKYNIPYNPNDVDWLRLIDQIKEYESLLNQAKEYSLRVNTKLYDPIAIKDSIEDYVWSERQAMKDQNSYYSDTRL